MREAEVDADYIAEMARTEMVRRFGEAAYTDGYSATLTVDGDKQQAATATLRAGLENYDRRHGFRGPIGQFDTTGLTGAELSNQMLNYPRVESLVPAVVTAVSDTDGLARVHTRHLGPGTIAFETMTWARRYRTENLTGPAPEKVSDVISVGDVIYTKVVELPKVQETDPADGENTSTTELRLALSQAPRVEGAIISLDSKTGAIEALAGAIASPRANTTGQPRPTASQAPPSSHFFIWPHWRMAEPQPPFITTHPSYLKTRNWKAHGGPKTPQASSTAPPRFVKASTVHETWCRYACFRTLAYEPP